MKLFSTKTHGVLDYTSVVALLALPRTMGWSKNVTNVLTASALGTLVYSLLTRYELGALKVLPVKTHLGLDALSGLLLAIAPFVFLREKQNVNKTLLGIGLFEISAALLTDRSVQQTQNLAPSVPAQTLPLEDPVRQQAIQQGSQPVMQQENETWASYAA
jgi:hypothetical protein